MALSTIFFLSLWNAGALNWWQVWFHEFGHGWNTFIVYGANGEGGGCNANPMFGAWGSSVMVIIYAVILIALPWGWTTGIGIWLILRNMPDIMDQNWTHTQYASDFLYVDVGIVQSICMFLTAVAFCILIANVPFWLSKDLKTLRIKKAEEAERLKKRMRLKKLQTA